MEKYRKKPVVIQAVRFDGENAMPDVELYMEANLINDFKCPACGEYFKNHGTVKTLEGYHMACPGDWIIRGIKGEHYPCKPDIFEKAYEKVD